MADTPRIYNHKIAARIVASEQRLATDATLADWERKRLQEAIDHDVETLTRYGYDRTGKPIGRTRAAKARKALQRDPAGRNCPQCALDLAETIPLDAEGTCHGCGANYGKRLPDEG